MAQLNIPDETFRRLTEKAAALNISVEDLIQPALDRLANEAVTEPTLPLTGDAWLEAFEAWKRAAEARADRYPPGFVVDDSRETIDREREDAQLR